jgi:glycosyltransferase involved in cell wall biosynthesis
MTTPVASIAVAAYLSRPALLHAALESALAQTESALEILVVDDSPDDRLRELVQSFGDARIAYRHNRPALGVAVNHWRTFALARGEFIAILNHDDLLEPTFIERLAAALRAQPDAVLAFCDHWVVDAQGQRLAAHSAHNSRRWGRATLVPGLHRPFVRLVAAQTVPMAMGCLFRASALPLHLPPDAGPAYDLWLAYLLAREGGGACYIADRLSAWRTHEANLTSAAGLDWIVGSASCWQAMAADPRCAAVQAVARRKAAEGHAHCAHRLWRTRRGRNEVRQHALASLRAQTTLRGAAALALSLIPTLPRWGAS